MQVRSINSSAKSPIFHTPVKRLPKETRNNRDYRNFTKFVFGSLLTPPGHQERGERVPRPWSAANRVSDVEVNEALGLSANDKQLIPAELELQQQERNRAELERLQQEEINDKERNRVELDRLKVELDAMSKKGGSTQRQRQKQRQKQKQTRRQKQRQTRRQKQKNR